MFDSPLTLSWREGGREGGEGREGGRKGERDSLAPHKHPHTNAHTHTHTHTHLSLGALVVAGGAGDEVVYLAELRRLRSAGVSDCARVLPTINPIFPCDTNKLQALL